MMIERHGSILTDKRKETGIVLLLCAAVFIGVSETLSGCAGENRYNGAEAVSVSENGKVHEEQHSKTRQMIASADKEPASAVSENQSVSDIGITREERYKAVLLGNEDFICTDNWVKNKAINLKNLNQLFLDGEEEGDSITVTAEKFALVDLDDDGEQEVVLWILVDDALDYGFEVLRYQEESVYGFTLGYREFMELKMDGTFIYSGGAADWGIGKLRFAEDGYTTERLFCVESGRVDENSYETAIRYFANGKPYTEEEFEEDVSRQDAKSDAVWYDVTEDGIRRAFAL